MPTRLLTSAEFDLHQVQTSK